jgi:hypothetical protein
MDGYLTPASAPGRPAAPIRDGSSLHAQPLSFVHTCEQGVHESPQGQFPVLQTIQHPVDPSLHPNCETRAPAAPPMSSVPVTAIARANRCILQMYTGLRQTAG